jgi:hypothetical protein
VFGVKVGILTKSATPRADKVAGIRAMRTKDDGIDISITRQDCAILIQKNNFPYSLFSPVFAQKEHDWIVRRATEHVGLTRITLLTAN